MPADDETPPPPALLPPEGCEVERLGDDLALLSFPLPGPDIPDALTAAEEDVVARVFQGESNAEIARLRGTSVRTVVNQLDAIYRKLDVSSRFELVALLRGSLTQ